MISDNNFYLEHNDSHSVYCCIEFDCGARYEPRSISGITHLTEHMLFRRTANYTQNLLYEQIERLGITLGASVNMDSFLLYAKCHASRFDDAVVIMMEMLGDSNWTLDDLEKEKKVIKAEIRENSMQSINQFAIYDKLFVSGNPHNILGKSISLDAISLDSINQYKTRILNASKRIYIAGNYNQSTIELLKKYLSRYENNVSELNCDYEKINEEKICHQKVDYYSVNISFLFDRSTIQPQNVELLKSALFDGLTGKTMLELREFRGYIYSLESSIYYREKEGVLSISFDTENAIATIASIKVIIEILQYSKKTQFAKEMPQIKPYYTYNLDFYYDNNEDRVYSMLSDYKTFGKVLSVETLKEIYSGITGNDLNHVAKIVFTYKNMFLSLTGKFNRLQLKTLDNICREL